MDIKDFLYKNKLKQVELAKYLGVTEAFISRMVKGMGNPSKENLTKILNNPYGWDTSMLINGSIYAGNNNSGDVNVQIGQNLASGDSHAPGDPSTKIAVLEKENEMLRERLKDKDDQLAFLKTLINK